MNYLKHLFEQRAGEPNEEFLEEPPEEADDREDWLSGGGWYYSEDDYGMYYRVSGHQDPFARAWLDIAAQLEPVETGAFEMLADRGAAGRCIKCHSIDQEADRLTVNWSPFAAAVLRPVTQFSHEEHFSLGDQKGCLTCHNLTKTSAFENGFENYDADSFASNFRAMTIATCRQCHNAEQAGSNCMTCHNYHVGDFKPTLLTVESLTK